MAGFHSETTGGHLCHLSPELPNFFRQQFHRDAKKDLFSYSIKGNRRKKGPQTKTFSADSSDETGSDGCILHLDDR